MKWRSKKPRPILVFTSVPDSEVAEKIAALLVEERAAACVQILPPMQSVYFWQGKLCRDMEQLLFIKASSDKAQQIESLIKENHPYTVPEIVTVGLEGGVAMEKQYWRWVAANPE